MNTNESQIARRNNFIEEHYEYTKNLTVKLMLRYGLRAQDKEMYISAATEGLIKAAESFKNSASSPTIWIYIHARRYIIELARQERSKGTAARSTTNEQLKRAKPIPLHKDSHYLVRTLPGANSEKDSRSSQAHECEGVTVAEQPMQNLLLQRKQVRERFLEAIKTLPNLESELLVSIFLEGLTQADFGKRHCLTSGAVSKLRTRALNKVQAICNFERDEVAA